MVPFKSKNVKATVFVFKVEIFIFLFQENYFKTQRKRDTKGQSKRQKVEFIFKLLMKTGKNKIPYRYASLYVTNKSRHLIKLFSKSIISHDHLKKHYRNCSKKHTILTVTIFSLIFAFQVDTFIYDLSLKDSFAT